MSKKLIQCPYCLLDGIEGDNWFDANKIGDHLYNSHPEKDYRSVNACITSWKMIGLYEEKIIEDDS